jgi:7-keto-8-aminopelargonate synthetase-like enzyme
LTKDTTPVDAFPRAVAKPFHYIESMTIPEPLQQMERTYVRWRGRKLVYFSGCDYFRLASHPAVLKAAADGLKQFGLNVAASRLTTGHHEIYGQLEAQLAKFFGAPDALLVSGGYPTSTVVAQALANCSRRREEADDACGAGGPPPHVGGYGDCGFSHVLLDERAHPALLDAAAHFGCPILKFKHRDAEDLKRTVARCGRGARFMVLTDGMFSHDGSTAPLKAYLKVLPRDAQLLVDDAHAAGVLGATGKGTLEHEGVSRQRIIQCVTLSKAFGVYGGAVLGTRELRERILARSRAFIGCTPLPLPLANAALASVKILSRGGKLRARLHGNAEYVKTALRRAGVEVPELSGPIIAIHPRSEAETRALRRRLLAAGIYPPFLKYAGAEQGFFRFVISSEHPRAQLDELVAVLAPHAAV